MDLTIKTFQIGIRMNIEDKYLLVEKYRPKELDSMVLPTHYKSQFQKYLNQRQIPHLMLYGPPGSGKTTIARIMINNILGDPRADCLMINGSSETGVGNIREFVQEYLTVPPSSKSKIKVVFIDEADYLSQQAQGALRHITEKFSDIGRFIFTINYKSKIIEPLFSRFTLYEFKALSREYITDYCYNVLRKENIIFNEQLVDKIITMYGSDIRRIVNTIQGMVDENNQLSAETDGLVKYELLVRSYMTDMITAIKSNEPSKALMVIEKIHGVLKETEIDFVSIYQEMFDDKSNPPWVKIMVSRYSNSHTSSMIPGMNFCAMCYDIISTGSKFYQK
jgi:replication factor C small subunit